MCGVANLFDVGLVFIVGLLFALISACSLIEIFTPESGTDYYKEEGKRHGTACRLEDAR